MNIGTDIVKDITSEDVLTGKKCVLMFWAPWHEGSNVGGPMDLILRTLATACGGGGEVIFGRVHAEEMSTLSTKYSVTVVPTFILLLPNGQIYKKIEVTGDNTDISLVTQSVQALVSASATTMDVSMTDGSNDDDRLKKRIQKLIATSPVMLFMKGNPQAPKCGFSRQIVELLKEDDIPFTTFDILSDEAIRQGLKKYSNWPTYPQLYVNNELVGGLDIIKEMKEEGSLKEQLGITDDIVANQNGGGGGSLNDRIKALLNRHKIMLFMKGVPSAPRCGFSRQMVEILDSYNTPYDTFNILEDEEIRQGLKVYSDWPTYPQLYINGELIGGLDICKEMIENNELQDMLK